MRNKPFFYKIYSQVQVDHKKEAKPIAFSNLFNQDIYPKRKRFTTPTHLAFRKTFSNNLSPIVGHHGNRSKSLPNPDPGRNSIRLGPF